jgi:hypothetical protein
VVRVEAWFAMAAAVRPFLWYAVIPSPGRGCRRRRADARERTHHQRNQRPVAQPRMARVDRVDRVELVRPMVR